MKQTNTPDEQDQRITALESGLEFQDKTISELNDELVRHHQRLSELEKKVQLMFERWPDSELNAEIADPGEEPPPPHY